MRQNVVYFCELQFYLIYNADCGETEVAIHYYALGEMKTTIRFDKLLFT